MILPFMVYPNLIFKFWYQIWIFPKFSYMVAKETILFGDTAFYDLAWPAVKILLPDLDSSKNFASGGIIYLPFLD